jgi:hypothetical protein
MTPHSLAQDNRVFRQCNESLQRFMLCRDITASVSAPASLQICSIILAGNQTTCIIIPGFLTLEEGTDTFSRNVGKELLLFTAIEFSLGGSSPYTSNK